MGIDLSDESSNYILEHIPCVQRSQNHREHTHTRAVVTTPRGDKNNPRIRGAGPLCVSGTRRIFIAQPPPPLGRRKPPRPRPLATPIAKIPLFPAKVDDHRTRPRPRWNPIVVSLFRTWHRRRANQPPPTREHPPTHNPRTLGCAYARAAPELARRTRVTTSFPRTSGLCR